MAVSRAGDWFGSPVNMASRVTGVAESVWEALNDPGELGGANFQASFAGGRRLKGIKNEVKLFRVRRGDGPSGKRQIVR